MPDLHPVEAIGIILIPVLCTLLGVGVMSISRNWIRVVLSVAILWAGVEIYTLSGAGLEFGRAEQAWATIFGASFVIVGVLMIIVTIRLRLIKRFG
jgi:hypothetical protein